MLCLWNPPGSISNSKKQNKTKTFKKILKIKNRKKMFLFLRGKDETGEDGDEEEDSLPARDRAAISPDQDEASSSGDGDSCSGHNDLNTNPGGYERESSPQYNSQHEQRQSYNRREISKKLGTSGNVNNNNNNNHEDLVGVGIGIASSILFNSVDEGSNNDKSNKISTSYLDKSHHHHHHPQQVQNQESEGDSSHCRNNF